MSPDPYGQHWSPYLAMGNNPVIGIDPDGGLFGQIRAGAYALWGKMNGYTYSGSFQAKNGDWYGWYGGNAKNFGSSTKIVVEPKVKITLGVQAKVNLGAAGIFNAKADVNLVRFTMLEGKANLADPFNPDSYGGDYVGRDGTAVEQSLGLTVGVAGKDVLGGKVSHTFRGYDGYARNDNVDYGVYAIVPVLQPKNSNIPGVKAKIGKDKTFHGVDIGAGAALILGVDVNLKLGYYE